MCTYIMTQQLIQVQSWIHDARFSCILVSKWWILGTWMVNCLLYQVKRWLLSQFQPMIKLDLKNWPISGLETDFAIIANFRSCTYPGALIHGHIAPVNYYYKVGQTVNYDCMKVCIKNFARQPTMVFSNLGV